jgi:hypothetical protein
MVDDEVTQSVGNHPIGLARCVLIDERSPHVVVTHSGHQILR